MIYLLAFFMNFSNGLFLLSTPLVAINELQASVLTLGFLGTAGAATYSLSCACGGFWAERHGRTRIMPLGCAFIIMADCSILWVDRTWHLFFIVVLASFGAGLFWPSLMKWMGEKGEHEGLGKRVGAFNIAWSAGIMLGPLVGGRLYTIDYRWPYLLGAVTVSCVLLVLLRLHHTLTMERTTPETPAAAKPEGDIRSFIYIAWAANFAIWFTIGATENLFPKLAVSLGISAGSLGNMMGLVGFGQMLMFLLLRHIKGWHFKFWPILLVQIGCAAGAAVFLTSTSQLLFGIGFLIIGLAGGVTYFSSLFYSLYHHERRGVKSGLHESILAAGIGLGPIAGGVAATMWGLRAPYTVCLVLILSAVLLETAFFFSARQKNREP